MSRQRDAIRGKSVSPAPDTISAVPHYYLWTIGCQMNRADSNRIGEGLEDLGYRPTNDPTDADLVVLNTCVVRQSAEDRVVGRLGSLAPLTRDGNHCALLVVGCFVGDVRVLREQFPYVDGFFLPSDIHGVLAFAHQRLIGDLSAQRVTPPEVSDYVPISYGCDHRCAYCIVTLRRGPQRSRPVADIVADVRRLAAAGTREVTLLGQNVDAYGSDLDGRVDLADVLQAVHDVDGLWRIRFLTSHPREMSQRIIDRVASLPRVCECWELAVQSGDDTVLRRMRRGYTIARFRDLVDRIRQATPDCAINTDVIVGFPGETEEQFENTLRLIREVRFDVVHVAAYSPRPGTPSAEWQDDVPPEEKTRRRVAVEEEQERIAGEIAGRFLGQEVEMFVDGRQKGRWRGRTRTNRLVFFESEADWLGRLALVRISWTGPWSMLGGVVRDVSPEGVAPLS